MSRKASDKLLSYISTIGFVLQLFTMTSILDSVYTSIGGDNLYFFDHNVAPDFRLHTRSVFFSFGQRRSYNYFDNNFLLHPSGTA